MLPTHRLSSQLLTGTHKDWRLAGWTLLATFCLFLAYIARMQPMTHDAFHEMSVVRQWLTTGDFPQNDIFAYTATVSPSVHHEWATGWLLYWSGPASPLGWHGITILKFLLVIGLWLALYRVSRGAGSHPIVFASLSLLTFPFLWVGFATIRAQLLTLCFLAVQLLMQQSDWRGRRGWVWIWIPMMIAWMNIHAGFVVGMGMMGFHVGERALAIVLAETEIRGPRDWRALATDRRQIVANMPLAIRSLWHFWLLVPIVPIMLLANPWTTEYVPYLVRAITMPRPTMLEWQPLWRTHDPLTTMIAWTVSVAVLGYVFLHCRTRRLRGFLFCVLASIMALKHIRHGSLYAVIWIALVPGWLSHTPIGAAIVRLATDYRGAWIGTCKAAIVAALAFAMWQPIWLTTIPGRLSETTHPYPVGAVTFLEQARFEGNAIVPFHAGSYVTWRLFPKVHVSIDGRYEVAYQPHVLPMHNRLYRAEPNWLADLHALDGDVWIIQQDSPVRSQLAQVLAPTTRLVSTDAVGRASSVDGPADELGQASSPKKWRIVYEDDAFVLLARQGISL
jgi:hypothetical protein